MDPEKLIGSLINEMTATVEAMSRVKTLEEKVAYSQVVKNLSDSLGIFLRASTDTMDEDFEFEDDYR